MRVQRLTEYSVYPNMLAMWVELDEALGQNAGTSKNQ
jgi:hypothetical protein